MAGAALVFKLWQLCRLAEAHSHSSELSLMAASRNVVVCRALMQPSDLSGDGMFGFNKTHVFGAVAGGVV